MRLVSREGHRPRRRPDGTPAGVPLEAPSAHNALAWKENLAVQFSPLSTEPSREVREEKRERKKLIEEKERRKEIKDG